MTQVATTTPKAFFAQPAIHEKFKELLGKRSNAFITSVLQAVNGSNLLQKANPLSIYNAAMVAATLDLPINASLGFAYIVPYKGQAQFQLGYKGLIQLAQRSGMYKRIAATPIYDGQLISQDPLFGFEFDFAAKKSDQVIGYAAHFALLNGFEKTLFMSMDQVKNHAKKFSATYKQGYGVWHDNFDAMAMKTTLKSLIGTYGPMSIELQTAVLTDQAVVLDHETMEVQYIDNDSQKTTELPLLDIGSKNFESLKADLTAGSINIDDIKSAYELTEEVENALLA
jgi:recombination protein RecT